MKKNNLKRNASIVVIAYTLAINSINAQTPLANQIAKYKGTTAVTNLLPTSIVEVGTGTSSKVGIGTAAPAAKLQIVGTGGGTTDLKVNGRIQTGDAANGGGVWLNAASTQFIGQGTGGKLAIQNNFNSIYLGDNGNVGIGTAAAVNPTNRLQVQGAGGGTIDLNVNGRILTGDSKNAGGIWCNSSLTQFFGQIETPLAPANTVGIYNSGWRLSVSNAGFVGVGTVNPTTPLHVEGVTALLSKIKRAGSGTDLTALAEIENGSGLKWRYGVGGTGNGLGINNGQFYIEKVGFGAAFTIATDGKIAIGNVPTPAGYKLYVETGILTEKIKVALKSTAQWADYVFKDSYKLKSLTEVEAYIQANNHLEGIPSANELLKEGGIDVNVMFSKQMEKIEELTLYMINLNKQVEALRIENEQLKSAVSNK